MLEKAATDDQENAVPLGVQLRWHVRLAYALISAALWVLFAAASAPPATADRGHSEGAHLASKTDRQNQQAKPSTYRL